MSSIRRCLISTARAARIQGGRSSKLKLALQGVKLKRYHKKVVGLVATPARPATGYLEPVVVVVGSWAAKHLGAGLLTPVPNVQFREVRPQSATSAKSASSSQALCRSACRPRQASAQYRYRGSQQVNGRRVIPPLAPKRQQGRIPASIRDATILMRNRRARACDPRALPARLP